MKKQTGFISSSSSVTVSYSSKQRMTKDFVKYVGSDVINLESCGIGTIFTETANLSRGSGASELSWKTYTSTSYQRIESFIEATEKAKTPFSSDNKTILNLTNYSRLVASKDNLYNGFVDIVITFPTYIRLAGIELLNPWTNKLSSDKESNYWRYLPSKFSIFKVNTESVNSENLNNISYETDVAKTSDSFNELSVRPIRYDKTNLDDKMTFLGKYEVNWNQTQSKKCFFKFNEADDASINFSNGENVTGTATWKCKQLVLRIFDTEMSYDNRNIIKSGSTLSNIQYHIGEYIKSKELSYGTTTKAGSEPSVEQCYKLIDYDEISSELEDLVFTFGSSKKRSYKYAKELKFYSGFQYKLGGIQLLLSPDIFSVSEMKMYSYSGKENPKVFIGEWNKDDKLVEYYGAGLVKRSEDIDISNSKLKYVSWKHNFNLPPKYLDVQVFAKFTIDYDTFKVGDVVSNLVNIENNPLTIKMTGTSVQVNLSNGIGFTNPDTGNFLTFKNGIGVHIDSEGTYDAYNAAVSAGANILDYGSSKSAKITGGFPFCLYFVVKRLF